MPLHSYTAMSKGFFMVFFLMIKVDFIFQYDFVKSSYTYQQNSIYKSLFSSIYIPWKRVKGETCYKGESNHLQKVVQ